MFLPPEDLFAWSCTPPRPAAVLVLSLAGSAVSATPVGLVVAYGFNEGAGTTTADATGGGNTGTISGRPGARPGVRKALSFASGRSADVRVADSAALHLTTGMTLEAWVNPSVNGGSWRTIVFTSSA